MGAVKNGNRVAEDTNDTLVRPGIFAATTGFVSPAPGTVWYFYLRTALDKDRVKRILQNRKNVKR
jgi:hypothetical protein